jgi:hypothetical protein
MKIGIATSTPRSGKLATLLLAIAFAAPALAQEVLATDSTPAKSPATAQMDSTAEAQEPSVSYTAAPVKQPKEGFWGRMNPFARKKWVKDRLDPINDQLSELDEVNATNAKDIRNMDDRAQAGIHTAQGAADSANRTAIAAGVRAGQASSTAQSASNHVDILTSTVNGLDIYNEKSAVDIAFRGAQPILSGQSRKSLDDLAAKISGQSGYILELQAHSPAPGSAGIDNSERLAEAVKRYLVIEHNLPIYRIHTVALGNGGEEMDKPVRGSTVHIRLMENSLAAQSSASLQPADSQTHSEQSWIHSVK